MVDEVTGNPPEGGSVEVEAPVDTAPAVEPKSLLEGGGSDAPVAASTAAWSEKWREEWTGGDEKQAKQLARLTDPKALVKSYFEAQKKLSQRAALPTLPENATPEQIAEYRKAVGVPEDGKYDVELGGGFVWADADKTVLEDFQKHAHDSNMPAGEFKKALAWYAKWQEAEKSQIVEQDQSFRAQSEEQLREEWGPDYKRNLNATASLFANMKDDLKNSFFMSRMPDGRMIGDHPEMVAFFSGLARELNPAATLVPASGGDPTKGVEEQIAVYEKRMSEDRNAWFKDTKAQEHYSQLLTARDKMKAR
jgi:hypothetical protein